MSKKLQDALRASPDNLALLMVVLNGHVDRGEDDQACALLRDRDLTGLSASDRLVAARVTLDGGEPSRALELATEDEASRR